MVLEKFDVNLKKLFFNLSYTIMQADGVFDESEKVMLGMFRDLLALKDIEPEIINLEKALAFNQLAMDTRVEIYYELLRVVLADSNYSKEEEKIMTKLREMWCISRAVYDELLDIATEANKTEIRLYVLLSQV